jgi:hypothetical protein
MNTAQGRKSESQVKIERLSTRIQNVIEVLGREPFTALQVTAALSVDPYDTLFALNLLQNEGKVSRVNASKDIFSDRWVRVGIPAAYKFEQVKVHPICERP